MVFGTFDIVHKGHLYFLEQAKKYGDYLIVVLARDKTVKDLKKRKPFYNEKRRKNNLERVRFIDKVVLGSLHDKYEVIKKEKPDIICLGYDQKAFTQGLKKELKKRNLKIRIIRLKPYKEKFYKSSKLRKAREKINKKL